MKLTPGLASPTPELGIKVKHDRKNRVFEEINLLRTITRKRTRRELSIYMVRDILKKYAIPLSLSCLKQELITIEHVVRDLMDFI